MRPPALKRRMGQPSPASSRASEGKSLFLIVGANLLCQPGALWAISRAMPRTPPIAEHMDSCLASPPAHTLCPGPSGGDRERTLQAAGATRLRDPSNASTRGGHRPNLNELLWVKRAVTKARVTPEGGPGPFLAAGGKQREKGPRTQPGRGLPQQPHALGIQGSTGNASVAISLLAAWLLGMPLEPEPVLTQKLRIVEPCPCLHLSLHSFPSGSNGDVEEECSFYPF